MGWTHTRTCMCAHTHIHSHTSIPIHVHTPTHAHIHVRARLPFPPECVNDISSSVALHTSLKWKVVGVLYSYSPCHACLPFLIPLCVALSFSEQEMRSFPRSWQMKTELGNWSSGWRMSSESRREKGPSTDTGALWPGSGPQRCPGDSEQGENQAEVRLRILGSSWMAFCQAEPESTGDSIKDAEPELSLDPYSDPTSVFLSCSKRQHPGNFFFSSFWLFFHSIKKMNFLGNSFLGLLLCLITPFQP